jgi:PRTRC genetic system protein A
MAMLTDNPTAAAVLDAVPCYPVPPQGRSPALDALRAADTGHGLAIGHDGVMLIVRRPWLVLDIPITPSLPAYLPYGSIGRARAELRSGFIPQAMFERIAAWFRACLPNEAAAFVTWDEATGAFSLLFPEIDEATPSRLVYRTPILPAGQHIVCDAHSHAAGPAFFSATDDADDAHATKIALVLGRLDRPDGPTMVSRLCAGGMFIALPHSPFDGDRDAA